jgi:hypothetical protein
MISRVILLASLVFELGSTTVSAEVPTDPEGFTKYVLNKFETAMPDHSFAYAGPLHIHDSKIGADTVGDEYLNGLFSLIVQKPESAETTVTRYVEKTAMLVADLRKADEKHVATGDFGPPFPDLGSGDRGLIVYVSKSSQNRYVEVSRWAGKGEIPEDLGRESDFRGFVRFLRPIYPHYEFVPSGQGDHCFPFGDVHVVWEPSADLWSVKMDPSQVDQILTNLSLNSRDAIAGVGKISIATRNVTLDNVFAGNHPDCVPGDYVVLSLGDDGRGMDAHTRAHVFEPYFTTKGFGKGTGLGLATIYGIVRQNHGFIEVESELGHGTTIRIYLPKAEAEPMPGASESVCQLSRGRLRGDSCKTAG